MKKMKKMFKFFMTVAAIAAITSCSNEEIISEEGTVASNERATLSVTISGGSQATRAIVDSTATADELKVSKATIFVFNANAYQADTTVDLTNHAAGNNKYQVNFQVPTGNNKRVFVGLNFTAAMTDSVKTKGLLALTYAINDQENLFYVSSGSTSGGFGGNPMFNEVPVSIDVKPGVANVADVTVERLTAKITVKREGSLALGDIKTSNATFSNSNIKFAMGNKNIKILPMKEQSVDRIDPNWDGNLNSYMSDFQHEFKVYGQAWNNWDTSRFVSVADDESVAIDTRNPKYAFENTHKLAQEGEVTFAAIMVKFTPDSIAYDFDNVNNKPVTKSSATYNMDSLFVVIDNNSYYYYTDTIPARKHTDYLDASGVTGNRWTTYYNQTCFYRVWLNSNPSSKEYQTKRNEFYNIGLENISRLGNPYPEIDDPTSIIGSTSAITVNITVKRWSLVNMGGIILGN